MLKARWFKHTLHFKNSVGTSRGVLHEKDSWFLILEDLTKPGKRGIGECGLLKGLSYDDRTGYEQKLNELCENINEPGLSDTLSDWPSIKFGLEMALRDLRTKEPMILFPSPFTRGEKTMKINGLIWMGEKDFMFRQVEQKLQHGFDCIKMKIGAIDWEEELGLLKYIRKSFPPELVELRVDANGAFTARDAPGKLEELAKLKIHSIEQPIQAGQWEVMAGLCRNSPLPIALDEELIGAIECRVKQELMDTIRPQYIILKPSLVGGFAESEEWIDIAEKLDADWWMTSALESNIGLNAIAQWTFTLGSALPQGLGTGQLYTNNIASPLEIANGQIHYNPGKKWDLSLFENDK
ncbi:MAG: o-succinylbenzoate synthase [Bacteroidales bacterium]|nr:o-succinylbenzoate synthase [Bacteroidales bacterium]